MRPAHGDAQGWIVVAEKRWRFNDTVLARPLDWDAHEAAEREFADAERDRLLYVAATRAKKQLIVARYEVAEDSPWGPLYQYLEGGHTQIDLPIRDAPAPAGLTRSADSIQADVERIDAARRQLALPAWRAAAVTSRVKGVELLDDGTGAPARALDDTGGLAWGRLVHASLEIAGRGLSDDALRAACKALLEDQELAEGLADRHEALERLVAVVETVTRSDLWQRAIRAEQRLVEAPFAIAMPAGDPALRLGRTDAAAHHDLPPDTALEIVEGIIDLVFREDGRWIIVDYKTDREGAALDPGRRERYQAQVDLYAACWTRITREDVDERCLLFVADGSLHTW
jgi:ATP-dependent helicase/nuclease subunit A